MRNTGYKMILQASILFWTLTTCLADLYDSSSGVVELTASNFNQLVVQSDKPWLVEFYAPWCGHCRNLAPEWIKAAKALQGIVSVGAVNMDVHQSVGAPYNIQGFPTIKLFGANKNSPQDYNGARSAAAIADAGVNLAKSVVQARLSGRGSSGGGSSSGGSGGSGGSSSEDVITLTDANFEKEVLNSKDLWLVEFFAPWCGHCKALAPEWAKAATELKGKVKLGALDATVHTVMASRYGVRGYPTIKIFSAGVKDSSSVEDFDGGRTASEIVAWALDRHAESIAPPEIIQVTDQSTLDTNCDKSICVVSVLPHILDSQAEGRNQYLALLKELGEKYKKRSWGWVWAEAGAQLKLEEALGIGGFGYPAMAVVNPRKGVYVILKGAFNRDGIDSLLRAVSVGRGTTEPIKGGKLPAVETTVPWDGKDGELPVEEDLDLSDIDMDEEEKPKDEL